MNKYTCFLDMDGVLVDFVGGVCKAFGVKSYSYLNYPFTKNYWNFHKEISGATGSDYHEAIIKKEFWANLGWMHDGNSIYELIIQKFGLDNVFLLTGTDVDPVDQVIAGKMKWIEDGPTELIDHVIFAKCPKGCIASPDKILIDDKEKNVVDWNINDGKGFLIPRHWNVGYENANRSSISIL